MNEYSKQETETDPPARQMIRYLTVTFAVSALVATVFTAWVPASLDPSGLAGQLIAAFGREASPTPEVEATQAVPEGPMRIGIVAGHSGPNRQTGYVDPGSLCPDGLTELELNLAVAAELQELLEAQGFEVDMMEEYDSRLIGYRAVALVSVHADSCLPIDAQATGYKVAAAVDTSVPDRAQRLVTCIADRYAKETELPYQPRSITRDMTEYHTFYEIHEQTPAVIIETGFMYLDREILTRHPEKVARGIVDGILCYVKNEPAQYPERTIE